MKKSLFLIAATALALVFWPACEKDDTTEQVVDPRDALVGIYNGTFEATCADVCLLISVDDSGFTNLSVSKGSTTNEIVMDFNGQIFKVALSAQNFQYSFQTTDPISQQLKTVTGNGYFSNGSIFLTQTDQVGCTICETTFEGS